MKTRLLIVIAAAIVSGIFSVTPANAGVQDFTFSNASFTYDLKRQADGTSIMHVSEEITANFPTFNQNKGITRAIPRTNQNGKNLVFPSQKISVTRNGRPEPIYETEQDRDNFYFSTGTDSYLTGDQVFGISYYFQNVITEFDGYQELYWDVNGTDSSQPFIGGVTATINLDKAAYEGFMGDVVCFFGRYGSDNTDCSYYVMDDTIVVTVAQTVRAYEGLTFALKFKPGTFVVPEQPTSQLPAIIGMISFALTILWLVLSIRAFRKYVTIPKRENKQFVKPEYQPPKDTSVLTAAAIYSSPNASPISAFFIDLAVRGNLRIIESETTGLFNIKSKSYTLELLNRDNLREDENELLNIFFFSSTTKFEIKPTTDYTLSRRLSTFSMNGRKRLNKAGLYHKKQHASLTLFFVAQMLTMIFTLVIAGALSDTLVGQNVVGNEIIAMAALLAFVNMFVIITMTIQEQKYGGYTAEGWKLRYYLLGLLEYIKLAETDRIAFHQSVEGAERIPLDDKSLVKLYEKLLPYAIIFNLEKSWSKAIELHAENYTPTWYTGHDVMSAMAFSSVVNSINSSISSSYGSGSGSSSSGGSGFSGGSSGGGGGGGGFGGR